ncbi:MAG: hypothetical protein B7733_14420 [Myxococcales bacterium FL481]|nr:MAG: hypothetical protein B7733_14420 [Myxococcales bacterium FL481]
MKKLTACLFGAVLLAGCADDDPDNGSNKGEVDRTALEDGLSITLAAEVGSVVVPFSYPVPSADDSDLQSALSASVSLVVRNDSSGATANLMSGALVNATPTASGQYAVALNETRDELTVTFFNETGAGQSLTMAGSYTATLSVATNDYVESLGTTAVDVFIQ